MPDLTQYVDHNFVLLDGSLAPTQASATLGATTYGVVLDNGSPGALVTANHLRQAFEQGASSLLEAAAGLPPTIFVRRDVDLADLAASPALGAFDVGAVGALVTSDDWQHVEGVVPNSVVFSYLGGGSYRMPTKQMGGAPTDSMLPGAIGGSVAMIVVRCGTCEYVNWLVFLDPFRPPPCQNERVDLHTLRIPT